LFDGHIVLNRNNDLDKIVHILLQAIEALFHA
jgi:hypothetical protein